MNTLWIVSTAAIKYAQSAAQLIVIQLASAGDSSLKRKEK